MKKNYLCILAFLSTTVFAFADPIDLQKAKEIAKRFTCDNESPVLAYKANTTRTTATNDNSPLYIFNRGNNKGFVIISGDNSMPEVLGYTESGNYNPDNLPPALLELIESYSIMIEEAQSKNAAPYVRLLDNSKTSVKPLVTAHWNQGAPYNNLCPFRKDGGGRALTGCVATAAAQIAYYWKELSPNRTQNNTPTYSYGDAPVTESMPAGTPLQWELMQDSYNSSTPDDMNNAVATLMYMIGTSTWLTYGSSTSGQISNLVYTFSSQLNLASKCIYKSSYTQEAWENLIYDDLINGRPIVYSGVSESAGGHAVVLDGYDATNNLYHFNFGWGGGGDGYFTVNDINGMNGFSKQQGMTFNIHPIDNNLNGNIITSELYTQMYNDITVSVENNGITPYKGLYLFVSSNDKAPSSLTTAKAKDLTTVIEPKSSKDFTFSHRIAISNTPQYLFVTDDNLKIVDSAYVNVRTQDADYHLKKWNINGCDEKIDTEISIDGENNKIEYTPVYRDNDVTLSATIYNSTEATPGYPRISCEILKYDNVSKTFVNNSQKNTSLYVENGKEIEFEFKIDDLENDIIYKAILSENLTSPDETINTSDINKVFYFMLKGANMTAQKIDSYNLSMSGNWDPDIYKQYINSFGDSIVCIDLRNVKGVNGVLDAPNVNTLFYVSEDANVSGKNIIKNGICNELTIKQGYDFVPLNTFTAINASLEINNEESNKWMYISIPFECELPSGIMARRLKNFSGMSISEVEEINNKLQKGIPYLIKTSLPGSNIFKGNNVIVDCNNHTESEIIKITYKNIKNTDDFKVLDNNLTQKFTSSATSIDAFCGYLDYNYDISTRLSAYITKDNATNSLAEAIQSAYNIKDELKEFVNEENLSELESSIENAQKIYKEQPQESYIKEETTKLDNDIIKFKESIILKDKSLDITELMIENPSFEKKNTSGWNVKKETGQISTVYESAKNLNYLMCGVDKEYYFYSYSNTNKGSASINQTIENLPKGYYKIEAMLATDEGNTITLYANNKNISYTGDDFGGRYFKNIIIDSLYVDNGTLEFGINGNDSWYKADNFRLTYIGSPEITSVNNSQSNDNNIKIWSENTSIIIMTKQPEIIKIYTINGILIKDFICNGFSKVTGLAKGLYIINGNKVLLK